MEEYKKKYEEALERAKRLGTLECPIDPLRTIGEQIFPELENNVNERMIECIRLALTHVSEEIFAKFGTNLRDVLFWLEKQSNSTIKWNKNTKDCKPKVNHSVLMKTTHGIAEGEWQGDQWYQYRWAGIVRDSDVLSWIELFNLEKQGEKKPVEWSEEDERVLGNTLWAVKQAIAIAKDENDMGTLWSAENWLKSIKERLKGE